MDGEFAASFESNDFETLEAREKAFVKTVVYIVENSRRALLFRVAAGVVAAGALIGGLAAAGLSHYSWPGIGSLAFMLLPAVFFGSVAVTGRGLTKYPLVKE